MGDLRFQGHAIRRRAGAPMEISQFIQPNEQQQREEVPVPRDRGPGRESPAMNTSREVVGPGVMGMSIPKDRDRYGTDIPKQHSKVSGEPATANKRGYTQHNFAENEGARRRIDTITRSAHQSTYPSTLANGKIIRSSGGVQRDVRREFGEGPQFGY